MLTIWDPVFNSMFDRAFDGIFDNAFRSIGLDKKKNDDGSLLITVDVPGIKEEDINIELSDDNTVSIKGERKTATSSYSVQKSFILPESYDSETLKAELKDGVLTLTVSPKQLKSSKEPKKIPISASK